MKTIFRTIALLLCAVLINTASAQFAPAAGMPGSTAVYKDSAALIAWATACTVVQGWQNVADTSLGRASVGVGVEAIGKAGENGVVSLGDGGVATLTFATPITNGTGFDFAVFENGFITGAPGIAFLEFAFVEVSSDGVNFVRFAAETNIQDTVQMKMAGTDCSLVNNLAGKYIANYGTPFDLDELKNEPNLNVNAITHVRIIDVVGNINAEYTTYDSKGNKVNDPYPTAFASGGFDLDAVGVINQANGTGIEDLFTSGIHIYPNPAKGNITIIAEGMSDAYISVTNLSGQLVHQSSMVNGQASIQLPALASGFYILHLSSPRAATTTKFMVE